MESIFEFDRSTRLGRRSFILISFLSHIFHRKRLLQIYWRTKLFCCSKSCFSVVWEFRQIKVREQNLLVFANLGKV